MEESLNAWVGPRGGRWRRRLHEDHRRSVWSEKPEAEKVMDGGSINTRREGNCRAEGMAVDGGSPTNEIDGKWKEAMGNNIGESGGEKSNDS
ncbi:hypothetical protein CRG98_046275 [Punica granatum]|uniref:Uncharacterized protein n=1 Tax=Punica granatum TaxID=22663 RepID=A0A2I0HNP8_PUNGR|nr:hypothetical protein CRG98_046275 [Punica granatum]